MPDGSTAALSDVSTATSSFPVDRIGTYVVELIVSDAAGTSSTPAQVQVAGAELAAGVALNTSPRTLGHLAATTVRVSVRAPSSSSVGFVRLSRLNAYQERSADLGLLFDDGSHGDPVAADLEFTTEISLQESGPSDVVLAADVTLASGVVQRTRPSRIPVEGTDSPDQARAELAQWFRAGQREQAHTRLGEQLSSARVLALLSDEDLLDLATGLSNCVVEVSTPGTRCV